MISDKDPNAFNITPSTAAGGTTTSIPEVTHQETTALLGAGASLTFDFNTDTDMIFDMFAASDQPLQVTIFVRQSSADIFRQLGPVANVPGDSLAHQVLGPGLRLPGSQVRIQILNSGGGAQTLHSSQIHARSM